MAGSGAWPCWPTGEDGSTATWRAAVSSCIRGRPWSWFVGDDDFANDVKAVRKTLGQAGLTLERGGRAGGGDWLCIPNNNPLTRRLYEGTKWAGEPGAGVWSQALRQGPRDEVWSIGQPRVNGVKCKCTRISVNALYGAGGIMGDPSNREPHQTDIED